MVAARFPGPNDYPYASGPMHVYGSGAQEFSPIEVARARATVVSNVTMLGKASTHGIYADGMLVQQVSAANFQVAEVLSDARINVLADAQRAGLPLPEITMRKI